LTVFTGLTCIFSFSIFSLLNLSLKPFLNLEIEH
jgi:hypothetical protein